MTTIVSETIYYVDDLDAAVEFYTQALGWKLLDKQNWGWARLDVDGRARVGLMAKTVWGADGERPVPRIGLQTIEMDAEIERLCTAGVRMDEVIGEPGSIRALTFYDNDGNAFFLWDDSSGQLTP